MVDFVNRKELLESLYEEDAITMNGVSIINNFPATNVRPIIYSRWLWDKDGIDWGIGSWKCENCKTRPQTWWAVDKKNNPLRYAGSKFCGDCGAKMIGYEIM